MEILAERNNVKAKNDFSLDVSLKQSTIEQRDVLDLYPEPDSVHTPPQLGEFDRVSNNDGEDTPVFKLQTLSVTENEDSGSVTALSATEDDKLANAKQLSVSSCERTSSIATASCSKSGQSNEDNDGATAAAESADVVADTLRKPWPSQTSKGQRRPGVILLGRGNSFSLGRSEVIFLHNTKPYRRGKGQTLQQRITGKILNGRDNHVDKALQNVTTSGTSAPAAVSSSNSDLSTSTGGTEPGRPSPPPLSNQACVHSGGMSSLNVANNDSRPITFTSGRSTEEDSPQHLSGVKSAMSSETATAFEGHGDSEGDELAALWARAELVMAGKQRAVLDVLAQFGVGETGKDTKDDEEEEEEDSVWQVVENKAHALVR